MSERRDGIPLFSMHATDDASENRQKNGSKQMNRNSHKTKSTIIRINDHLKSI